MFIQCGKQAIQQAQLHQLTIGDDQCFAPLFIRHEIHHIGNRAGAMQANFGSANIKLITILLKKSTVPDGITLIGPTVKRASSCRPDKAKPHPALSWQVSVQLYGACQRGHAKAFSQCYQLFTRDGLLHTAHRIDFD